MNITKKFSQQIESCIMQTHINVAEIHAQLGFDSQILKVGSGTACYLGQESFLSQVIAWGFDSDINSLHNELKLIEEFYINHNCASVNIELSPFCGNHLVQMLSKAGYRVCELSTISFLELDQYVEIEKDIIKYIERTKKADLAYWAKQIATGFDYPDAAWQFELYAKSQNVIPFHYLIGSEIAGGATIAVHGESCDLGVTSIILIYRGQGIQKLLLNARLIYAKQYGAKVAVVTTEPGSISDLNIQKLGFQPAYTRIKLTKNFNITEHDKN